MATSSSPASAGSAPAQLAGLERIPAVIRQLADRDQLEVALVENLQRADLGPMEEAAAYRALIGEFDLTHEEIARRVGRAKSTITNTLRLLDLDPAVQAALVEGRLSEGTPAPSAACPSSSRRASPPPSSSRSCRSARAEEARAPVAGATAARGRRRDAAARSGSRARRG
jgi:ParB family chromosome partitioning protein